MDSLFGGSGGMVMVMVVAVATVVVVAGIFLFDAMNGRWGRIRV